MKVRTTWLMSFAVQPLPLCRTACSHLCLRGSAGSFSMPFRLRAFLFVDAQYAIAPESPTKQQRNGRLDPASSKDTSTPIGLSMAA
eukprot:12469900-Heterocapsa_arctica.AAC.1